MPVKSGRHTGRVVGVRGQVALVSFAENERPKMHDVLQLKGTDEVILEVVLSDTASTFYCLILRGEQLLRRGTILINSEDQLTIPVGRDVLGRAFDVFSDPHDGGPKFDDRKRKPLFQGGNRTLKNVRLNREVIETGIKAIDFFAPLLSGGKMALLGGAGIGKTVILTELTNRLVIQQHRENTLAVFSAVGERSREAEELYTNFKKAKVLPFTSLILGQMGENPAIRFRTAYAGATIAEYFRDEHGSDVLFFMDNIYRFAQAGYELSMVMNMIPSEDGYQPTLASEMASLQERLISTDKGTITSFMALFVPSDDITDSAVRAIMPFLDTMIVLSREVFQSGRFPAIDLLTSTSAALNPLLIGQDHYSTYIEAKQVLEEATNLERIVSLVGEAELSPEKQRVYGRALMIISYMSQDLFVSQEETGRQAETVERSETVQVVHDILAGKYDAVDPADFRYLGSIKNLPKRLAEQQRVKVLEQNS